jgi:hypothetical protein
VTVGQQIAIQSIARAGAGIARVDLWVDGVLYSSVPNPNSGSYVMSPSQLWSPSMAGNHTLVVLAYDLLGRVSAPASVLVTAVGAPTPPMVWFSQPYAPTGRIVVQADDNVLLEYSATDSAGVTRMELWVDGQIYAADTNPGNTTTMQVQHNWSSQTVGDHTFYVRAYDTQGLYTDSSTLDIGVADRNPPSVSITSPANGAQFPVNQTVPVAVSAGDSKGITHVELWVDSLLYTTWNSASSVGESSVQLNFAWQRPLRGSHTLYVIADDSVGLTMQTPSITVNITPPLRPPFTPSPGPHLAVNPVTSPTNLLYQTITGRTDPNVNVYINDRAGRFRGRSGADGTFAIMVRLEPQVTNRLVVGATFDHPGSTVTETQVDINGNPLNIVQVPAPTVTPTITPSPTPVPPRPTATPSATPTPVSPTPTSTPSLTPVLPRPTATPSATPIPLTPPPTSTPSATPVPPTHTATPSPTLVPPTPVATPSATPVPRRTPQRRRPR